MRVEYTGGQFGPLRLVSAGSGLGSQNAPRVILGLAEEPHRIHVYWPGGAMTIRELAGGEREVTVNQNE